MRPHDLPKAAVAALVVLAACAGDDKNPSGDLTSSGAMAGQPSTPNMGSDSQVSGAPLDAGTTAQGDAGSSSKPAQPDATIAVNSGAAEAGAGEVPAQRGDAGAPNSSEAGAGASARSPLTGRKFPLATERVSEAPTFRITRPKDLKASGELLPVVAWANGGCLRSDFSWQPLFDRWAGAGFVVLSLTGTGSDGDILGMFGSTSDAEHKALIDWAVKANTSGPYAGALDLKRIALAGNSCGGVTALQTAAKDKRAAAVFVLSGSSAVGSVDKDVLAAISIPVGYITGSPDEDIAAPNAEGDYAALTVPSMLVQRTKGDHLTVSTDETILPENAEIALQWLDLALYGNKQAYDRLTSADVCEHCTKATWTFKSKNLEKLLK